MREQPENNTRINSVSTLNEVIEYSDLTKQVTKEFLGSLSPDYEDRILKVQSKRGYSYSFSYGKVIRHIVSHEIHHIGQISVWSREIGLEPISSDLLTRDYF
ncbi:DinB family protein [Evansella clarkii]|uniref:DinB family protein n=1 Tax=Evansella clarkii TaxID=79879 RepID=UPI00099804D7|nr:DinB family protein [Evansella clarkii]